MNNEEQKRSLVLFFTEFLKTDHTYNEETLKSYLDMLTIENINQWMKIYQGTENYSSCSDMERDWILCVEYIIKHNLRMLSSSYIMIDGKTYYQDLSSPNSCTKCIFEDCKLLELCNCIPCEKGNFKECIYIDGCLPIDKDDSIDKDNSTGKKYDTGKTRYDLLPPEIMKEIAEILTFGAAKYGDNNWQKLEDFNNRYYAAMERHIQAWRMGEDFDPESGKHHLSHALTNVAFLVWKNINKE